jgi:Dyp-type peroxidase family
LVNLDATRIDPDDAAFREMLANLQGNILKGHGRDRTVHIFFRMDDDVDAVREGLKSVVAVVTSAAEQHEQTTRFKRFGVPGGLFANMFLSASGYQALGIDPAAFGDPHFQAGMKAAQPALADPPVETWDEGYQDPRVDAMLLLADDDEGFLLRRAGDVIRDIERFATVVAVERGVALRNEEGEGIEHFGYADGRSQPIFYASDMQGEGTTNIWDPAEPLRLALLADPLVGDDDAFGSYFVFRKLEQDVRRFIVREHELADELGLEGRDRERAGAMAVGRFRDGTPLVLSQTDGFLPVKENDFDYAGDPEALKCPFHGHIRKTNPRGDTTREFGVPIEEERKHRVVRRGITYGDRNRHPNAFQALDDLPVGGVGLLFMCFQSSLQNQFVFMQESWANNEGFVRGGTGVDPIIGQGQDPGPQKWLPRYGEADPPPVATRFSDFVTMKGGEFFFAPSIPFLRRLKE